MTRTLICLLAAGLTMGVAAPSVAAPSLRATETASSLPVQVFVDNLTPRVVRPHSQVVVVGRIVNASADSIDDIRARLRVRSRAVGSRSELASDAIRTDPLGEALESTTTSVTPSLAAGATAPFQVVVAADDLHLGFFGVYPFAVEALGSDAEGPNDVVGRTPTFLTWVPSGGGFRPTRLAWVLPLTDAPNRAATPVFPDDHLATDVGVGGRLNTLLAAGTRVGPGVLRPAVPGRPQPPDTQQTVPVTWAADPALLQSLADMSDGYRVAKNHGRSSSLGSGQPAATTWLDVFRRTLRAGPVGDALLALPYANVDVTAVTRAGLDSDLAAAVSHGRDVATSVTGVAPTARLGLPPGGFVTTKALDNLVASGVRTVVLRESALPLTNNLIYTPSAGAPLVASSTDVTALLYDETLARIVATADRTALAAAAKPTPQPTSTPSEQTPSPNPAQQAPTAAPTTARLLEQRFLAETALITAERPLDSRDVVVVPPPGWDPVPGLATSMIEDTGRVPWLAPTSLTAMTAASPEDSPEREPLTYPESAASAELPNSYLSDKSHGVVAIRKDLTSFRSILAPPIGPTAVSLDDATLRAESASWRDDLSGALALRQEVADDLATKRAAVNISSSRRIITLASRRGTIPITISNDLDQAVVIRLQLSAVSSARLTAPVTDTQTIAAGRKLTNEVKAVVNQAGLFPVKAQLLTPDGEPYGPPVTLRLRSTAYGQLALGITAGALGALFLAVVIRLIRRNRRRQASPEPS
jgi:hypothetical protein